MSVADLLAAWALPHDCYACGALAGRDIFCADCRKELPMLPAQRCPQCALPSPAGQICGTCLRDPPHFDATFANWSYDFPVREMILALKYQSRLALAPWLAASIAGLLRPREADCLIPVPLHSARLAERGFNQSVEIGRHLAKHLDLPMRVDLCVKDRMIAPQASLPWKARRKNIRGAFRCTQELDGKTVAVVDDVMTTGATLDEFARVLKQRGAARVVNVVIARTLRE